MLDLVPDRDPVTLPVGLRLWTLKDHVIPADQWRYRGYDTFGNASSNVAIPGGVILFDANGRLTARRYGLRYANVVTAGPPSALGLYVYGGTNGATAGNGTNLNDARLDLRAAIGLVLFDREAFLNQQGSAGNFTEGSSVGADAPLVNAWIDANTTPIFINRYDGTLMRAE